jgi:hypothetical protein
VHETHEFLSSLLSNTMTAPYGTWSSPVTSEAITKNVCRFLSFSMFNSQSSLPSSTSPSPLLMSSSTPSRQRSITSRAALLKLVGMSSSTPQLATTLPPVRTGIFGLEYKNMVAQLRSSTITLYISRTILMGVCTV